MGPPQVLQEGLAHVCLITPNMTVVRQRIEVASAKKRRGDVAQHEKGMQRYHDQKREDKTNENETNGDRKTKDTNKGQGIGRNQL